MVWEFGNLVTLKRKTEQMIMAVETNDYVRQVQVQVQCNCRDGYNTEDALTARVLGTFLEPPNVLKYDNHNIRSTNSSTEINLLKK